jgi:2'-5' RNA ligase
MRLFIGIPIPNSIKESLIEIQKKVLLGTVKSRQTRFENFHITLLFLGEIEVNKIDEIIDVLESFARLEKPILISLAGLGHFVKKNDVVLWVGINQGLTELKALAKKTKNELKVFYTDSNSSFSPHVTLARGVKFSDIKHDIELPFCPMTFTANEIILYQSIRIHDVLTYIKLHSIQLNLL